MDKHVELRNPGLTPEICREIQQRYFDGGIYQHQLASEYGCSQATINRIVCGKHWSMRDDN